ncbi:hypothetical protein FRB94_008322 [Tulasnella sp. JGI-2019a]|nr:hypothetical protein FRB93_007017 [Tulasnella sp. JGI-2019a]KAG9011491.1 hypothetical protein FRB94_008322 [Tulasnella sp. JGI-2019a]
MGQSNAYGCAVRCDEPNPTTTASEALTNVPRIALEDKPAMREQRLILVDNGCTRSFRLYRQLRGASALRLTFGASLWICLTIHAIGVECYLNFSASGKPEKLSPSVFSSTGPIVAVGKPPKGLRVARVR